MEKLQRRQEELGVGILKNCRNEWYRRFPFLDGAFTGLTYQAQMEVRGLATDGDTLYFHPEVLLRQYLEVPERITRGYLHMLLHCLYFHILPEKGVDMGRWNLACDLAVELTLLKEIGGVKQSGETERNREAEPSQEVQSKERGKVPILEACGEKLRQKFGGRSVSAEELYGLLEQDFFPYPKEALEQVCFFDDHGLWMTTFREERRQGLKKKWEKLGSLAGENRLGTSHTPGTEAGTESEEMGGVEKSRYDYGKFLKQFAILREEVELDMESFDYIYYSYGLEHYKNMPLIEHLEYKEGHKLEELVIAIDTSGSCSTEMVRQFLQESYAILGEKENFFQRMKVYLIQCDCVVQNVACVRSREEWERYCKTLRIQGRAGTDFRPVFRYVEKLREEKELKDLKALIYFTDGDGIYPREAPEYETAFVFVKKAEAMKYVPKWARSLVVQGQGCEKQAVQ